MARLVLVLLAALAAGIGLAIGRSLLYVVAGVLVLCAIGLWVRQRRKDRRREERKADRAAEAAEQDDDLSALGITDIRPRDRPQDASPSEETAAPSGGDGATEAETEEPEAAAREPEAPEEEEAPNVASGPSSDGETAAEQALAEQPPASQAEAPSSDRPAETASDPASEDKDVPSSSEPRPARAAPTDETSTEEASTDEALAALVRAARLAVGARAACLLAQEELALEYRIAAADAAAGAPALHAPRTTFSTDTALLSARAAGRPVTRRSVGRRDGGSDALAPTLLGYYREPPTADDAPEAVLLAPVPLPDDPTTYFLLFDGPDEALAGPDVLLERFARLFSQLLAAPSSGSTVPSVPSSEAPSSASSAANSAPDAHSVPKDAPAEDDSPAANGRAAAPPREPAAHDESGRDESERDDGPRPRREIVAEEISRAHDAGREMALALVYLNRAETITDQGEGEMRAAERALKARLRQAAPRDGGRVERFGELITYGVFLPYGSAEAERWAVALKDELAEASAPLEGGVSVGLALMRDPAQDPEALRENATEALREAYTTGACAIVE